MSFADLLVPGRVFDWEHAQNHRVLIEAQTTPVNIAAAPFYLDPREQSGIWDSEHQSLHDGMVLYLNSDTGVLLTDEPLFDSWTTFANQTAHAAALQTILAS